MLISGCSQVGWIFGLVLRSRGEMQAHLTRLILKIRAKVMYVISYIYGLRYWCSVKDFEETIRKLNTPFKIASWLAANVKYVPDTGEYWQTALETFNRRIGDCDDFARFACYCLNRHGYEAYILTMWDASSGHATALFEGDKGYETIGTCGLVRHRTDRIEIVVGFFCPTWDGWIVFDEELNEIDNLVRMT